jgi:DSF synthase
VHPITREEMDRIVDVWVDAAMRLEEKDLKMMHRLVRAQSRRTATDDQSAESQQTDLATAIIAA